MRSPPVSTTIRAIAAVVALVVIAGVAWLLTRGSGTTTRVAGTDRSARTTTTTTTSTTTTAVLPTTPPTTAPAGLPLPLVPPPTRIAWMGDSVAGTLAAAIAAEANARGMQLVNRTTAGCGMVRGIPADDQLAPLTFVAACDHAVPATQAEIPASGADVVTWLSTWETANRVVDGQAYVFGTPDGDARLLALIDESVQRLTAGGARLVFVTVPPDTTGPRRPVVDEANVARALHLNDLFRQYAAAHADRVAVLDLAAIVCPGGPPCPVAVDGVVLRPEDGGHFAGDGPAWVAPRIIDRLVGPG